MSSDLLRLLKNGDANAFRTKARAAKGDLSLEGETFGTLAASGFDLSQFDLTNTEWADCILSGFIFSAANLEGAYFHGCTLVDCDFTNSDLSGASFEGCVIRRSKFLQSRLDETELTGVDFEHCELLDVDARGVEWENVSFQSGKIAACKFAAGTWNGITLRETVLGKLDLREMELSRCAGSAVGLPPGFSPLTGKRTRIR